MKELILSILMEMKPDVEHGLEVNLIETGVLDSFDLLIFVTELEEATGLSIPGNMLVPENFININSISEMLNRLEA